MGMPPTPKAARQVTKQQYDASIADFNKRYASEKSDPHFPGFDNPNADARGDYNNALQSFKDSMSVLPPPAPDLADETVQRARQAARRRLLMGGLTGPLDLTGASLAKPPPGLTGI